VVDETPPDALLDELITDFTIACPAFLENGRMISMGNLFAGDVLLWESTMLQHPLAPMLDSNLVNVLARQTQQSIGAVFYFNVSWLAIDASKSHVRKHSISSRG
jgi:3-dehydrotetronate 4-kinase